MGPLSRLDRAGEIRRSGAGKGKAGDAYEHLLKADETRIDLVVIDGVPRYATKNSGSRNLRERGRRRVLRARRAISISTMPMPTRSSLAFR